MAGQNAAPPHPERPPPPPATHDADRQIGTLKLEVATFGEVQGLDRRRELSVRALIAVLATDAAYNITPNKWMDADLEHLQMPRQLRFVFASAKASAAAGLMLRHRSPYLARLAAGGLVIYFVLAIGAHVRIRDEAWRYGSPLALLGWAAVTLRRLSSARAVELPRSPARNPI